ncbi:MAG: ABC transporter ATP-binding protein [Candidatus Hermodarchaeota archaeon]
MSKIDLVIEAQNLVKIYKQGNVKAVDGLNLNIRKGEIYAFIGANGSGKTTAIKMLTGVLDPTSGSISIFGLSLSKNRKIIARNIGIAPQDYSLYNDLTVIENIKFFAGLYGMNRRTSKAKMNHLIQILRLEDNKDTLISNLSGGMKRRVSIACALIHSPHIVFFDEATVGIDPILRKFFWEYFNKLKKEGLTLIITSHVMDEAERADRIGLIRAGKLIDEGTPKLLKEKHHVNTIEEVFLKLSDEMIKDD